MLLDPDQLPFEVGGAPEPEDWCDPRTMAVVDDYLHRLPADLRDLYQQRFALEQSQDAASSSLGISRRMLRTREQRLRKGLRAALRRAGISPQKERPRAILARQWAPST